MSYILRWHPKWNLDVWDCGLSALFTLSALNFPLHYLLLDSLYSSHPSQIPSRSFLQKRCKIWRFFQWRNFTRKKIVITIFFSSDVPSKENAEVLSKRFSKFNIQKFNIEKSWLQYISDLSIITQISNYNSEYSDLRKVLWKSGL